MKLYSLSEENITEKSELIIKNLNELTISDNLSEVDLCDIGFSMNFLINHGLQREINPATVESIFKNSVLLGRPEKAVMAAEILNKKLIATEINHLVLNALDRGRIFQATASIKLGASPEAIKKLISSLKKNNLIIVAEKELNKKLEDLSPEQIDLMTYWAYGGRDKKYLTPLFI